MWDNQIAPFSEYYTVIRYDRRYSGNSWAEDVVDAAPEGSDLGDVGQWLEEQPESTATYEDLRALLDHLEVEQTHLLGLQEGGEVALDFALEYPERLSALILVNTVIFSAGSHEQYGDLVERGMARAEALQDLVVRVLENGDWTPLVDWALDDPSYAASTEATRRRMREILADNVSSGIFAPDYNARRLSPPAGERLAEITVPVLLVFSGERDPDIREFDGDLSTGIPGSREVSIPDASATVNMDLPQEFNGLVMGFLEGL